jgi:hypothetical protein
MAGSWFAFAAAMIEAAPFCVDRKLLWIESIDEARDFGADGNRDCSATTCGNVLG